MSKLKTIFEEVLNIHDTPEEVSLTPMFEKLLGRGTDDMAVVKLPVSIKEKFEELLEVSEMYHRHSFQILIGTGVMLAMVAFGIFIGSKILMFVSAVMMIWLHLRSERMAKKSERVLGFCDGIVYSFAQVAIDVRDNVEKTEDDDKI
jgi:hypothetical protein